jgi:peptidoglycan hydrolase CwlO-like protein
MVCARIYLMRNKTKKNLALFLVASMLFVFNFSNFKFEKFFVIAQELTEGEEAAIEEAEEDLEDDIDKQKDKLEKELKAKKALEEDIGVIQGAVYSTQKAIVKTEDEIETTEETIDRKNEDIENLNKNIEFKKVALKRMIQEVYYNSEQPLFYLVLEKDSFFETMTSDDSFLAVKKRILSMLDEINQSKITIEKDKEDLEETKEEKEELLEIKESQKKALDSEKFGLQVEVNKKIASIDKIQSKLSDLKNDLNKLLGESYDTDDIKDAIKFANKATDVSKGFLFGMLSIESNLGKYTGGCTYKESRMNDTRKDIFKDICKELDYNYKKQKVSCPPSGYTGTGGAMGAAQFMPDTWKGYESKIAAATGHNPPDPWNLVDGVMAMALKLENDGATNSGDVRITSPCTGKKTYIDWEDYAAMKYLGWSCYALTNYAPAIQSLSGGYKKL